MQRYTSGTLASQLALRGHIAEAWPLAVSSKSFVAGEIAVLGLIPADSAIKVLRPWLNEQNDAFLVPFPVLAMVGDTTTLLTMASRMDQVAQRDTARRTIVGYVANSLRAYAALARKDTTQATQLFAALPDSVISVPVDIFIRARLIGRQDPKRAIAILERYSASPDLIFAARELERGRLAEKVGDREAAVDAYAYVAAVWERAEVQSLKDGAKEANDAIKRLDSDGRLRAQLSASTKR
jgi:hypothetical protein